MCFQDWRIGRLIRSNRVVVTAGNNGIFVIPRNSQRVGLTLLGDNNNSSILLADNLGLTLRAMLVSGSVAVPFHITLATHGDLPTTELTLLTTGGAGTKVQYIEYTAPEDVLTLGLQQLQREYPGWKGG